MTVLIIVISLFCVLWATLVILTGFHDSMGNPRNHDLPGILRVFCVALAPCVVPVFFAVVHFRAQRRSRMRPVAPPNSLP